jgi:tetratricopeptide (TPR) repeat protein
MERAPRRPRSVEEEIRATARPKMSDRAVRAFEQAVSLMERGRDAAAVAPAREAKDLAPRSGVVREVLGMALYRSGQFRDALRELQAYRRITGRADQNHLIADSHRALGAPEKAIEPAREAIRARIGDDVRAEAAVVGASALAELGRTDEAMSLLRSVRPSKGGMKESDLRLMYATGDILARAGRRAEAAEEFRRIMRYDADAFDAAERLAELS